MKKITFCVYIFICVNVFSQKTLDSIRTYSLDQSDPAGDFTRQYFIKTTASFTESEDKYISGSAVYNKKYLRVGKYDTACKDKFITYTVNEFDQFSQQFKTISIFYNKYDQDCHLNEFIYYDNIKMDTFLVAYYDMYDDQGNFGSEIDYYDFDGNGLKKYVDNQIFYKYNSQNKLIETTIKENLNGKYFTTSKRILTYDNEGRFIKSQFYIVDTLGNENISYEATASYFNGGSVETTYYKDFSTNQLYPATLDSIFLDKDNDPTFKHRIGKNSNGETIDNNAIYYYYSGSSATSTTSLDPDITINDFITVEGVMFFTIDNPKWKKLAISVSDINGRLIYKNTANDSTWHSPQINVNTGMYILKVATKDGIKVQKKISF